MSRKMVIMAGGTGGHVFPICCRTVCKPMAGNALARVRRIVWKNRFSAGTWFPIEFINIRGLRNHGLVRKLLAPFQIIKAVLQAFVILRRIKPDDVLGMGAMLPDRVVLLLNYRYSSGAA